MTRFFQMVSDYAVTASLEFMSQASLTLERTQGGLHFEHCVNNILSHLAGIHESSYPWRSLGSWRFHLLHEPGRHEDG